MYQIRSSCEVLDQQRSELFATYIPILVHAHVLHLGSFPIEREAFGHTTFSLSSHRPNDGASELL